MRQGCDSVTDLFVSRKDFDNHFVAVFLFELICTSRPGQPSIKSMVKLSGILNILLIP